jgi:hypothetical protein
MNTKRLKKIKDDIFVQGTIGVISFFFGISSNLHVYLGPFLFLKKKINKKKDSVCIFAEPALH